LDQGNTEAPNLRFLLFSFRTSRNSGSDRTFYADAHFHLHEKNQASMTSNQPIISSGIILYKRFNDTIQYLMIQRKDSFGLIELLRGNYDENNENNIQRIIGQMTKNELENVLIKTFSFNRESS
jgi:hypothetical protein